MHIEKWKWKKEEDGAWIILIYKRKNSRDLHITIKELHTFHKHINSIFQQRKKKKNQFEKAKIERRSSPPKYREKHQLQQQNLLYMEINVKTCMLKKVWPGPQVCTNYECIN